jgi:hypothetical protein
MREDDALVGHGESVYGEHRVDVQVAALSICECFVDGDGACADVSDAVGGGAATHERLLRVGVGGNPIGKPQACRVTTATPPGPTTSSTKYISSGS